MFRGSPGFWVMFSIVFSNEPLPTWRSKGALNSTRFSESRFSRSALNVGSMKARYREKGALSRSQVLLQVSLSSRLRDIPRLGDGRDSIPVFSDFAGYIPGRLPSIPSVGDSAPSVDIPQCAWEKSK